jgi:hypothetical protein
MNTLSASYNQFDLTVDSRISFNDLLQQVGFFCLGGLYTLMMCGIGLMEIMGIRLRKAQAVRIRVNG